jgi:MFS family permease
MFRRPATREVVFSAMILAIFMVSVEATIVATAIPTIVADLGGLRYFSWVFGAYLLTQTVTIPIYGRLADFFGRKPLLIIATTIFLTGSILCGFAHTMVALIAFARCKGSAPAACSRSRRRSSATSTAAGNALACKPFSPRPGPSPP